MIPKLQKKVNELGKQRVRTPAQLSDRIGETVAGIAGDPCQRHHRAHRWRIHRRLWASIYDDPLRDLPPQVLHQVPQQLH